MQMAPPIVTGISPKEGTQGTRVTIRGENLGNGPQDLIGLSICGNDCLLSAEWLAPNKIVARCGSAKGWGDIIVTTRSGGRGTCTIQFRSIVETVSPLKECAVWLDESHLVNTYGRKRVTIQAHYQQDNPLGLSDEGNDKKFPEEELHDAFPDGSGNLTSENFVPVWFLVENHHNASFQDLKAGLSFLKRKVSMQKEGELSFLKANISAVLDQLDTLSALQENILKDKATTASLSTGNLEEAISKAKDGAGMLFKDVLARQDRAESTRNVLGVLQRFKFLFNLPSNIERNIQKGDYDVVINDYIRARSLFSDTKVQIFRKVYQEVEQRIARFRDLLRSRLHELPMQLDTKKHLIRYLVSLETPGDPFWECIVIQKDYFLQLLKNCKNTYQEKDLDVGDTSSGLLTQSKTLVLGKFSAIASPPASKLGRGDRQGSSGVRADVWQDRSSNSLIFIEDLCTLTIEEFSNLWKLGQSYFSGDLYAKDSGSSSHQKRDDKSVVFSNMLFEIMSAFCLYIREPLLCEKQGMKPSNWPEATRDATKLLLQHGIQKTRNFYSAIRQLHLPSGILTPILQLLFDLRVACLRSMFANAIEEVNNLPSRETWNIEVDPKHGGITQLPFIYENTILKTIQLVRDVLHVGPQEIELLGNSAAVAEIIKLWHQLLLGFPHALQQLANLVTVATSGNAISVVNGGIFLSSQSTTALELSGNLTNEKPPVGHFGDVMLDDVNREKLLLVILGNCNFTKFHVLPRVFESFVKHGFPKADDVAEIAVQSFTDLDRALFERYIELKCDPIIGVIEQHMYAGQFDWEKCQRLLGVRPYIKEILLSIIAVHYEIHSISPSLVDRAMKSIIESVFEEISRLFSCVISYSHSGNLQAKVDIMALKLAFNDYLTNSSRNSLQEAIDGIPNLKNVKDNKILEEELNIFQRRMKLHLMCFKV